ncbi:MAG: proteobacterial dedicated sortase system histidine kinase [Pseudomonadales bacterium]|nr:proteobacterial dedicated sortase system histidine kinase [Pseudomonadales bacterium]
MAELFKNRFGIRSKLLFMASFLLIIPWLGYRYILEMEQYLSRGQEQTVLGMAQALATALNERPELFNESSFSRAQKSQDLYVYPVFYNLEIDDRSLLDWRDYQQYEQLYRESSTSPNPQNQFTSFRSGNNPGDALAFRHMVGEYNRSLYAYFKVQDKHQVFRARGSLRVDRSDSLRIAMVNRDGVFERYVIAPYGSEYIYPYRIGSDIGDVSALEYEPRITGRWNLTGDGYEIELRMPLDMLGERLGMAIYDVDDPETRALSAIVSTSGINAPEFLGTLRRPTPEIDRIVAGMGHTNSRIQVVDRDQRVLLSVGDIQTATGLALVDESEKPASGAWQWIEDRILHPVYYQLLTKPTSTFIDELYRGGTLAGEHVLAALEGRPSTRFRTLPDSKTRILEAAYPIVAGNEVLGTVVVDQNMNGIRTFRNQALETLFDTMLAILLLVMLTLFIFASSLSGRIRGLRNQAEKIIDASGRLSNTIMPSRSADEIGDLSRSFANIVERLSQYTHYLENMSSRLSHELRTPVTVVRSSLENLGMLEQNQEAAKYIQRAEEGIKRLNLILTNMSEASRLEQILQASDKEQLDLTQVISGSMEGYAQVYPEVCFNNRISGSAVIILGVADYLAQLMDKLIANAVEFSHAGQPIYVECYAEKTEAVITVRNSGPYLAEAMKDRIFDSMVSVRPEGKQAQPHLGMGLHIARIITEFHGAYIFADNLLEEEGVIVCLRLPLYNPGKAAK